MTELEAELNMLGAINGQLEVDNGWAVDKANEHRVRIDELEAELEARCRVLDSRQVDRG